MRRPPPSRYPLVRRPSGRTILTAVLACLAAIVVFRITSQAAATSASLGDRMEVWVAEHGVAAGATVSAEDVSTESWPVAFVPQGAVTENPTGRTARTDIAPGEVLIRTRLTGEGSSGPAGPDPGGVAGGGGSDLRCHSSGTDGSAR